MRVLKRNPWLTGLGTVLSLLGLWWGSAQADATTDIPGSVLFFPKVIADGTRDTLIQITNTSPNPVLLHCEYINASGRCGGGIDDPVCSLDSDCPAGVACSAKSCQAANFSIGLTKQQPTIWRVSTGRQVSMTGPSTPGECQDQFPSQVCPGIFGGPEPAPPAPAAPFRGELLCYEVDPGLVPIGQNAVKGEATIQTLGTEQISEYNAIAIRAVEITSVGTSSTMSLDNIEYNACPAEEYVNHYAQGADDIAAAGLDPDDCDPAVTSGGAHCTVSTELTMVPCTLNIEQVLATQVTAQFRITNEFETNFSASTTFSCWFNGRLDQIPGANFSVATLNSSFANTRIRTATGFQCTVSGAGCRTDTDCPTGELCRPQSGILAVAESFHSATETTVVGTAAINVHFNGSRAQCQVRNQGFTGVDCSVDGDAACGATRCGGTGDTCDPADTEACGGDPGLCISLGGLCATDTITAAP